MKISEDSLALFLLCRYIGLPDDAPAKPLSARAWSQLETKLDINNVALSKLSGASEEEIKSYIDTDEEESRRLAWLLNRNDALTEELQRLEELGIWVITRFDEEYPLRFIERLKSAAPPVLYGSGDSRLLNRRGLAVVGSRNIDDRGVELTEFIGNACAESNLQVYSGGARGVDKTAMIAAINSGGSAAGLLADSLEKNIRASDARQALEERQLVLATSFSPNASFNVGNAMARNRLIYALADYALVIASDAEKGGTWAGGEQALKDGWIPVFVVDGPNVPDGNRMLISRGGVPFPDSFDDSPSALSGWLEEHAPAKTPVAVQGSLF